MIVLYSLIDGLHPEEKKSINHVFQKANAEGECLFIQKLYSILLSAGGKLVSDKELSILMYGNEKLAAIAKLKSRLFQFLLEIMCSEAVLSKEQLFDHSDYQMIRIRKKMLQVRILFRRRNKLEASVLNHLLSEIIKEAKEYEQYDVLLEALFFKKARLMVRTGFSEIKNINAEIEQFEYANKALLKANSYYIELIANQDLAYQKNPEQITELLKSAIHELEENSKIIDSASITYISKLLTLDMMIRENKHKYTIDVCLDILNILNNNKHIYRNERVGFVYDNISLCHIYQNNFDESISSARKAQEYYAEGSFNLMISKQQEFMACFYAGSFVIANSIILELLNFQVINAGEFRHDKYLFFESVTLYKLGNLKKSLIICNQALEITKDKSRWSLGIRYLRLMSMIELLQYDQACAGVEALRKLVRRNKDITLRDGLIYRAFNEFAFIGFSGTPTNKLIEIISELSVTNSINSWNYYTHELIPIHSWIQSKIGVQNTIKVNS